METGSWRPRIRGGGSRGGVTLRRGTRDSETQGSETPGRGRRELGDARGLGRKPFIMIECKIVTAHKKKVNKRPYWLVNFALV